MLSEEKEVTETKGSLSPSWDTFVPVPEICLSFGWHVYICQQVPEACMKELWVKARRKSWCVHPAEMKLLGLWVCSLLTVGRNKFENLRSFLRGCKRSFLLNSMRKVSDVFRPPSQQTIRKECLIRVTDKHKPPIVGALWSQVPQQ